LLGELSAAGAPVAEVAKTFRALWADTQARIEHALLSSLTAGLDASQAVTLADRLTAAVRSLARASDAIGK
jgi:hypothetical protein